ncbi:peptidoglycan DD-metalloendopeptidase family protein [Hoeflea sp.]|uniref:peptidoglycan DD-metalloendopeptidase family protein n=1 Tax=Hoeflea sp. TaxID=1940281 RepID=UPI00198A8050|nr:peptidoglycan DD-metalloendopeptidase family protein [Hoeflea sp.]MBC7280761.1 peptidoglycan DD-metalloendopeptidase family protein [Hoeflea sp.]
MRVTQTVVPGVSVIRLLGIALLAGSAAACSSDVDRFSFRNTDQLMTASVPAPSSSSLAPMADVGGTSNSSNGAGGYPQTSSYPQAPASSQAFPGDYRSPSQPGYDPTPTGSVPSMARTSASSSSLIGGGNQQSASISRQALPSAQPALAPATQAFPERPQQLNTSVQVNPDYAAASTPVISPDPIVTGTAPQGAGWTTTGGTRITLGPGETIYNLSKRYGVPASEIMKANGIDDASRVSAGRQLLIPVYVYSRKAPVSAPDNNPNTLAANSGTGLQGEAKHDRIPLPVRSPRQDVAVLPSAPALRSPSAEADSSQSSTANASNRGPNSPAGGAYTVTSGDTLSKIARNHGVSVDALKSANNLTGSNIRIGLSLVIPAAGTESVDRSTTTASVNAAAASDAPKPYTPPVSAAGDSVAAKTNSDTASIAPASTGIDKFRWPARGQVITGFAKTENGKRNDGIDISLPAGTPVKAAENGVVIYSGDGLKEYGKTVLVRHDDGLVTVYAHANTLDVARGDKVVRGQVIASSGMTGVAKTPRLHFEVRKNATPVDPIKYLE